jgi:hypothetical protein
MRCRTRVQWYVCMLIRGGSSDGIVSESDLPYVFVAPSAGEGHGGVGPPFFGRHHFPHCRHL